MQDKRTASIVRTLMWGAAILLLAAALLTALKDDGKTVYRDALYVSVREAVV